MARTKKVEDTNKEEVKKTVRKRTFKKEKVEIKPKDEVKVIEDITNKYKCKYCGYNIDKGMTICPNCRRKNKSSINFWVFGVLAVITLFAIIFYHFVDSYLINPKSYESYVNGCTFVSYTDMVRVPKNYLHKDVVIVGRVIDVEGYDDGFYNQMTITVDMNLFEDGEENLITVNFSDNTYEKGFIKGDLVKVYGNYATINGNEPSIDAEYVELNK